MFFWFFKLLQPPIHNPSKEKKKGMKREKEWETKCMGLSFKKNLEVVPLASYCSEVNQMVTVMCKRDWDTYSGHGFHSKKVGVV
jgi:hypothetical protein